MDAKSTSYTKLSRLAAARAKEYSLQDTFKLGYRNKEDVSNLPAYTLVVGSQNVLTNAAEQVGIRQGYVLDGSAGNQNTYGVDSAYDFLTKIGITQNLRKWGTTIEVRYVNPATQVVSWIPIYNTLTATKVANFTNFWDLNTEVSMLCLFVNGDNNVYEWSGGAATVASVTSNSITISGTNTIAQLGFYNNGANVGKFKLLVDGITYTYTGPTTSTAYSQNPTNNKIGVSSTQWNSQQFTTGASAFSIQGASVIVSAASGGIVANFTATINADNAGVPGAVIATATASEGGGAYSPGDFTLGFNFPTTATQTVLPNTLYHLVISSQDNSHTVYTGTSSGVGTHISTDAGVTWSAQNGYLNAIIVELDTSPNTFAGVNPDPTLGGIVAGDAVIQPVVIGNSTTTANVALPTSYNFDLISTLSNQVWYGCLTSTIVYVSKTNNYYDTRYSTPQRLPAEGALLNLDSACVGLSPQGTQMYVASGTSQWWLSNTFQQTVVVAGISTPTETLFLQRIKTATGQAPQSQALIARFKNSLIFVSNEPIVNTLGLIENIQQQPQVENMSDPIKYDIDAYDFTDGQVFYYNYFLYIAVPSMGVVRMYNVNKQYWEAPQLLPISRFYVVDDQLYGHSALTNESYQLFTGYNDNGNPINAVAAFPYVSQEGGSAPEKKNFNKQYTEGYIAGNTLLTLTINYDYGGFSGNYSTNISGANKKIIFNKITDGSLGQNTLGTQPIGTILNLPNQPANPKFRVVNTFPRTNCFEYQLVYSSNDVDQQWLLLRFGPAVAAASDLPTEITE